MAGERSDFDLALAPAGSRFFHRVWAEVRGVGYGQTVTYAAVARRLGGPTLARAIGRANGRNLISIIIPCHRLFASDGSDRGWRTAPRLTGYAAGIERKRQLLDLERPRP